MEHAKNRLKLRLNNFGKVAAGPDDFISILYSQFQCYNITTSTDARDFIKSDFTDLLSLDIERYKQTKDLPDPTLLKSGALFLEFLKCIPEISPDDLLKLNEISTNLTLEGNLDYEDACNNFGPIFPIPKLQYDKIKYKRDVLSKCGFYSIYGTIGLNERQKFYFKNYEGLLFYERFVEAFNLRNEMKNNLLSVLINTLFYQDLLRVDKLKFLQYVEEDLGFSESNVRSVPDKPTKTEEQALWYIKDYFGNVKENTPLYAAILKIEELEKKKKEFSEY